jgi:hypothetical protein
MTDKFNQKYPLPKAEHINVQIHKEDLSILVDLLDTTSVFYEMACKSVSNVGDSSSESIFKNRIQLINAFNAKFKSHLAIGEPESRDEH